MKPVLISLFALAAAVAASAARAQTPAAPPTQLRGVDVTAGPGPKVTASYPADGSGVPGGVLVLKVTFDQTMTPSGWAFGKAAGGGFPDCLDRPRLLADQRTFALLCTVAANQSYAVEINPAPDFQNAGGRSARPFLLHFSTTGDITRDLSTALSQAGLTDDDEPLMAGDDPGDGVSQSTPAPAPDAGAPTAR